MSSLINNNREKVVITDESVTYVIKTGDLDFKSDEMSRPQTNSSGSYVGRLIVWLNKTSSGRMVKMAANALATVATALLAVYLAIQTLAVAIFGVMSMMTIVGVPIGILALCAAALGVCGTKASLNLTKFFTQETAENYHQMNRLAIKENFNFK